MYQLAILCRKMVYRAFCREEKSSRGSAVVYISVVVFQSILDEFYVDKVISCCIRCMKSVPPVSPLISRRHSSCPSISLKLTGLLMLSRYLNNTTPTNK